MDFFKDQMDYIYFFYGLAFMLLAAVCFVLGKEKEQRLPWLWLGLFGVSHGVHEWMDLITFSFGSSPAAGIIHAALLIVSFVFLFEFGRAGTVRLSSHGPGRWVYLPLLALTALGGFAGLQGIYASSRYVFGITGGILSAFALFRASATSGPDSRKWLGAGSFCIGFYTLFAGIIVSHASFFPASLLNDEVFLNITGTPVQLIRGLLAIFSAISIWAYSQSTGSGVNVINNKRERRTFLPVAILVSIIIIGWIMTQIVGNYAKQEGINPEGWSILLLNPIGHMRTYRLFSIFTIFVFCSLVIVFFVVMYFKDETAGQLETTVSSRTAELSETNRLLQAEILERMQMEAALRDSEERFRTLFDLASDGILLMEPSKNGEAVIVDANISIGEMHGFKREELIGKPITFLNAPGCMGQSPEMVKRLINGEHHVTFEIDHVRKDGLVFPVEVSAKLIQLGGAPYILALDRDITGRKEIEEQMKNYTRELEKYAGDLAKSNRDLKFAEEELRRYREHLEDLVRDRTTAFIKTNESLQQEISERKRAEETLKDSELRYRKLSMEFHTLFNSIPDALMLLSPELKIVWANESAAHILGKEVSGLTGRRCHELWHNNPVPCDKCPAVKSFRSGKTESSQSTTDDGRFWNVRAFPTRGDDGEISNVIVLTGDITEKITLQAETIRAGQLASIGELAAGVAHEINNPVNSIINYAQVILDEEDTDVAAKIIKDDIAGRIIKEGGRIAGIIKSLLSFARDRKEEKQQANVHLILQDSLTLVEAQMRKDGVKLRVEAPADLPEIFCHSQQIQQVFLNVINNARYALNQKYKGPDTGKRFEIYAEEITVDLRPYVRIRFNDAGTGIPANIIDKIMNPFFSTKPSSKGTGLGLSISHGIISDHGGRFTIESIEGEFTNVIIDLPVMERT